MAKLKIDKTITTLDILTGSAKKAFKLRNIIVKIEADNIKISVTLSIIDIFLKNIKLSIKLGKSIKIRNKIISIIFISLHSLKFFVAQNSIKIVPLMV